mmetsp:Transcript_105601/g.251717  ORF Transcript_105601/g.251717 Transcript_105601/m.251717 type:complete len:366 (+) Transcript_105601:93-1190(+)
MRATWLLLALLAPAHWGAWVTLDELQDGLDLDEDDSGLDEPDQEAPSSLLQRSPSAKAHKHHRHRSNPLPHQKGQSLQQSGQHQKHKRHHREEEAQQQELRQQQEMQQQEMQQQQQKELQQQQQQQKELQQQQQQRQQELQLQEMQQLEQLQQLEQRQELEQKQHQQRQQQRKQQQRQAIPSALPQQFQRHQAMPRAHRQQALPPQSEEPQLQSQSAEPKQTQRSVQASVLQSSERLERSARRLAVDEKTLEQFGLNSSAFEEIVRQQQKSGNPNMPPAEPTAEQLRAATTTDRGYSILRKAYDFVRPMRGHSQNVVTSLLMINDAENCLMKLAYSTYRMSEDEDDFPYLPRKCGEGFRWETGAL